MHLEAGTLDNAETWKVIGKEKLHSLYWEEGLSTYQIADRYGLKADESVRKKMARMSIARRKPQERREFNPDRDDLHALYQELTIDKIARRYDVGQTIVWRRLKEFGIKLRDYEDGGHRKKPGRVFSESHKKALSKAHIAKDWTGERNRNWRGGVSIANWKARQGGQYRRWRREALQYAENQCQDCGTKQGTACECCCASIKLHVHHAESFAANPSRRYDPTNSVVLCPKCHRQRHNGKSGELLETPNG